MIILLILLQIKHFICDFPLQNSYQYLNKGIYGHRGGILHSFIHATISTLILTFFTPYALILGIFEGIIHYHIDWAKVKINKYYGWKCDNSEKFWYLLGLDQLFHQLTYILIIYLIL